MRVVVQRGSWEAGKRVSLDASEVHHLRVRRAHDGERVEILDGAGLMGTGNLVRAGREWMVEVEAVHRTQRPPETTLAVFGGDRGGFLWVVGKSVGDGVPPVVPAG